MAAFSFTPPPSTSTITNRVEKATSHLLSTPDWALNMDICDIVNNDQGLAKDVVKTVKKRLQNKNPKVQFFTLTLLETLVKNCGDHIHYQVVERDILQDMTKIVKKGSYIQVRDKALVLLDSWQEAFGGPGGKYPQYYWAYVELKRAGVTFPERMMDNTPPIFTPPATHPVSMSRGSVRLDDAMASERGNFGLSDLNQIRNVMGVLDDMLQAVNPHDREAIKDEVITDLVSQCRSNQKRLMEQLSLTGDEEILGQGLELNDILQSLLAKHDAIASGAPLPIEASKSPMKLKTPIATPIEQPVVRNQLDEEDDEFAQLARRKTKFKQVSPESTSLNSSDPLSPSHSDVTTTSEATSSASNALVLLDPPTPVRTHKEEQNIIDLLSLALTINPSPPHTPLTPPSASSQQGSPSFGQGSVHTSQSYPANQGYAPYNDYVAPWAQHTLPSQPQPPVQQPVQYTNNYAIPPSSAPYGNFNSMQSSYHNPAYPNSTNTNSLSGYPANLPQYYNSVGSVSSNFPSAPAAVYQQNYATRPTQQYGSFGSGATYIPTSAPVANYSSQPQQYSVSSGANSVPATPALQNYNSFSSRATHIPPTANNAANSLQNYNSSASRSVPTASPEQQMKGNELQTGTASSQKPYYHPDSLFAGLVDLRSSGAGQKRPPLSGTSGQSMISGRK